MPLTIPPYEGQGWTDNSTPDLSAETLNAVDDGIAAVTNGVNAIAAAVVNKIINDPEKIASIAVAYAQQQQINTINSILTALGISQVKIISVSSGTVSAGGYVSVAIPSSSLGFTGYFCNCNGYSAVMMANVEGGNSVIVKNFDTAPRSTTVIVLCVK